MELFDPKNYQLPDITEVDWKKTNEKLAVFLLSYKVSRERVGVSILPKMTERLTLFQDNYTDQNSNKNTTYFQEYMELHNLFVIGLSAIVHPFRPDFSIRRKQIFLLRYVYGLSISLVSERIHYQKNVIIKESKISVLQFANAISILEMKK